MTTWTGAVQVSEDDGRATTLDASGSLVLTGTLYGIASGTLMFRIRAVDVAQGRRIERAVLSPTLLLGTGAGSGFVNVFGARVPDVPALDVSLLGGPLTASHVAEVTATGVAALDVTAVLQEIINQPGWVAGNAVALMVTTHSGRAVSARQIDGSPAYAAGLAVDHVDAARPGVQVSEVSATSVGASPSVRVQELTVYTDAPEAPPGTAYVWAGSQWATARPYVWTGSQWAPVVPYIWTGSQWAPLAAA